LEEGHTGGEEAQEEGPGCNFVADNLAEDSFAGAERTAAGRTHFGVVRLRKAEEVVQHAEDNLHSFAADTDAGSALVVVDSSSAVVDMEIETGAGLPIDLVVEEVLCVPLSAQLPSPRLEVRPRLTILIGRIPRLLVIV
jgi:hypothetical protein